MQAKTINKNQFYTYRLCNFQLIALQQDFCLGRHYISTRKKQLKMIFNEAFVKECYKRDKALLRAYQMRSFWVSCGKGPWRSAVCICGSASWVKFTCADTDTHTSAINRVFSQFTCLQLWKESIAHCQAVQTRANSGNIPKWHPRVRVFHLIFQHSYHDNSKFACLWWLSPAYRW